MRSLPGIIAIGAALAAAACKPPDTGAVSDPVAPAADPRPPPPAEPRPDLRAEEGSPDLFGAWIVQEVSGIEAVPQGESWDRVLLVGLDQLEILSQCITIGPFAYHRTEGGGISVRQTPVTPRPRGSAVAPAPVRCARTLHPAERILGPLLLAARDVRVKEDGAVSVAGPAGTVTLRRPPGALSNPRGDAPAPLVPPSIGAWRFVSIDGRALPANERMELLLRPSRLEWRSGCVIEARERSGTESILIPGPIAPLGICERMQSPSEVALGRLFANPVEAQMRQDGRLRLQGSGVTAELEPLTS